MYLIKKKKNNSKKIEDLDYETWKDGEVGYWRKANAIHKWFVDKVQNGIDDCGYYLVKKEDFEELKDTCERILKETITEPGKIKNGARYNQETQEWEPILENGKNIINYELCEELLPTQSGFFFGSTDYDEYYLKDLEDTVEICKNVLDHTDFENEEVYYSSSW